MSDRAALRKALTDEFDAIIAKAVCDCSHYSGTERNGRGEKVCEACGGLVDDVVEKKWKKHNAAWYVSHPSPLSTPKEIVGHHGHLPSGPSIRWPALYDHLKAKGMTKAKAAQISNGLWNKKHGVPTKHPSVYTPAATVHRVTQSKLGRKATRAERKALRKFPHDGDGDGFYSPFPGAPDRTPVPRHITRGVIPKRMPVGEYDKVRKSRATAARRRTKRRYPDAFVHPNLDDWDGQDAYYQQVEDTKDFWQVMEPCKQIRRAAAQIVGIDAPAIDVLRDEKTMWGGHWYAEEPGRMEKAAVLLMREVNEDEGRDYPFWRASGMADDQVDQLLAEVKTGDLVDFPLLSFSSERQGLGRYIEGEDSQAKDRPPVLIKVEPGAKGFTSGPMSPVSQPKHIMDTARAQYPDTEDEEAFLYYWENVGDDNLVAHEVITGGRFRVKSIRKYKGGLTITLTQLGTFDPDTGEVNMLRKADEVIVQSALFDSLFDSPMPTVKRRRK